MRQIDIDERRARAFKCLKRRLECTTDTFVDTFFDGFENNAVVRLGAEHVVELNAGTFADLIHRSEPLRKALSGADSVTLLASGAGRVAGRGGFAHDFQRALAERFDGDRPVFATRGEVDLSVAPDGSRAVTTVSGAADFGLRRIGPVQSASVRIRSGSRIKSTMNSSS